MTNRYQKEIEEILKKAGESPPVEPPSEPNEPAAEPTPRRRSMQQPQGKVFRRLSISYKHLLLLGVALLAVSIFFGGLPMLLLGAALLAGGYVMYYRAPRTGRRGGNGRGSSEGGRPPKMWRGRTIDPGDDPHFTDDPWGRRR